MQIVINIQHLFSSIVLSSNNWTDLVFHFPQNGSKYQNMDSFPATYAWYLMLIFPLLLPDWCIYLLGRYQRSVNKIILPFPAMFLVTSQRVCIFVQVWTIFEMFALNFFFFKFQTVLKNPSSCSQVWIKEKQRNLKPKMLHLIFQKTHIRNQLFIQWIIIRPGRRISDHFLMYLKYLKKTLTIQMFLVKSNVKKKIVIFLLFKNSKVFCLFSLKTNKIASFNK